MKLSIEQANKLFSGLLAGVAVVENEQEADTDADIDNLIISINEAVINSLRPAVEEQVKPALESAFTGRYLGALRSAAQRVFNIPRRELEEMSIEQVLAKCKATHEVRLNQSGEQQQTQLETTIQGYEQQLEQLKTTYEQQLAEERNRYAQRDIEARCLSIVERLPRKGGDLQEQADMLRYKMQSVFEVRYNEQTKRLEFYKEGQPATGTDSAPLSDEDFARQWAEKAGILVHDTRHISPADVQAGQQGVFATGVINIPNDAPPADTMEAIAAWAEH